LEERDDEVFLQHEFPRASPVVNRVRAEFALAAYFGVGRAFIGRSDLAAQSVWLEHDRPDYADEYSRIFGVAPSFGRAKTGFAFSRDLLSAQRFDRDPKLFSVLRSEADFMLSSLHGESVVSRVRDLVSYAEGIERPSMAEVARRMSTSERSLRRVLATEGRTFRDIVDEAMKDRAHRLLRDPSLTIADVAVRVGFREVSAFHRAVRRWTSLTVRELQAELRKTDG
jgi:AraC-like DNA-binding protein